MKIKIYALLFIFYNFGQQEQVKHDQIKIRIDRDSMVDYNLIKLQFNHPVSGRTHASDNKHLIEIKKQKCTTIKLSEDAQNEDLYITSIKSNKKNHEFSTEHDGNDKVENGLHVPHSICQTINGYENAHIPTFNLKVVKESAETQECNNQKNQKSCVCNNKNNVCFKLIPDETTQPHCNQNKKTQKQSSTSSKKK